MTSKSPLAWPLGWKRNPSPTEGKHKYRRRSGYWTLREARDALYKELGSIGVDHVIISSNLRTNLDGSIAANQARPDDCGVAIYFQLKGSDMVMACDDFIEPESNIRRLTLALEAMRALKRNGGGAMMEKAFTGFRALPAPKSDKHWTVVLSMKPGSTKDEIKARHKHLIKLCHSDVATREQRFTAAEVNKARDEALAEIGG